MYNEIKYHQQFLLYIFSVKWMQRNPKEFGGVNYTLIKNSSSWPSEGQGGRAPLRGPRGSAPGGVQGAEPLVAVPLASQRAGVKGAATLVGFGATPRNLNEMS